MSIMHHFAVFLLMTTITSALPGATEASSKRETRAVPLHPYAGRLVTVAAVADTDTLRLLLDTGGGETLISPEVAGALGCSPSGRTVGFRMSGERVEFAKCDNVTLQIGGHEFLHPEIGVWDIMSILPEGLPPLDGVLALNTLVNQPFTLDLAGRELIFETPETLEDRVEGMMRVEARVSTGLTGGDLTLFLRGLLDEPGWFLFDSGNLDAIQIAPHLVREKGPVPRELDREDFKLAGFPASEASIRVAEMIYDGALSESFLRKWIWTFDLNSGALWASPVK
jgi:hypothetical protein